MERLMIQCPQCGASVELDASIRSSLEARLRTELEADIEQKAESLANAKSQELLQIEKERLEREFTDREKASRDRSEGLERQLDELREAESESRREAGQARKRLKQTKQEFERKLEDARADAERAALEKAEEQISELREREAESRKLAQEAEDGLRKAQLEIERKVEEARAEAQRTALEEAAAERRSSEAEKARQLRDLEKQLRKANEIATNREEDLRERLAEQNDRINEFKAEEKKLRKRQRELEAKAKDLELEVDRRLDAERGQIEKKVAEKIIEEHRLRDAEKDKHIEDLRTQIGELERKAQSKSQQTRGEAAELTLEGDLRSAFPLDQILQVKKGARGADLLQKVCNSASQVCGIILWESKNTARWNDSWIPKLKSDVIAARADVGVLASVALPDLVSTFGVLEGLWVTSFQCAVGLATALRVGLLETANARRAAQGQNEKAELLVGYLSSPQFRKRVEAVIECFTDLRDDLNREKQAVQQLWAKREKQIERAAFNIANMYGEMRGIVGPTLPRIRVLELAGPEDVEGDVF